MGAPERFNLVELYRVGGRWSDFFLAELVQVGAKKLGAAHLVTKIVTGNEQTDTQTGENYKCHGVTPLILFFYRLSAFPKQISVYFDSSG